MVALVRAAGGIPIAKTNVSQMLFFAECTNPIWGRTINPHNKLYSSMGSSGGEAALLAMDGAALGWGTDKGGSLRSVTSVHSHHPHTIVNFCSSFAQDACDGLWDLLTQARLGPCMHGRDTRYDLPTPTQPHADTFTPCPPLRRISGHEHASILVRPHMRRHCVFSRVTLPLLMRTLFPADPLRGFEGIRSVAGPMGR